MTVISVEHLTKKYDLGVIGTGTLSRDLNRWWARLRGQSDPYSTIGQRDHFERIGESILALDDVSFKVEQGEALGIIGKNGAGKSTLLKILSRVTAPTSGVVKVKGRIGSLLEVGTGFHPELTGRENVYLNGAILGMRKDEVERKFDEIVDFSGVEKFIDTPVKRYSSGMYVRLAFAVAAHLDPEILVVDEVLAVGDAEFQKKCLGKMGDVAGEGRTVLFVSHNMAAIQQLCKNAFLLQNGKIIGSGLSEEVVNQYLNQFSHQTKDIYDVNNPDRKGNHSIFITDGRIVDHTGKETKSIVAGKPITFEFDYQNNNNKEKTEISMTIFNSKGIAVTNTSTVLTVGEIEELGNKGTFKCVIERTPFPLGDYRIAIALHDTSGYADYMSNALFFTVDSSAFYKNFKIPSSKYCTVMVEHHWEHEAKLGENQL